MEYDKEFDKVKKVTDDPEHPDNITTIPPDFTLEEEPTTEPTKEELQSVPEPSADPVIDILDTQEWEV